MLVNAIDRLFSTYRRKVLGPLLLRPELAPLRTI